MPTVAPLLDYGKQPPSYRRWLRLFVVALGPVLLLAASAFLAVFARHWWIQRAYIAQSTKWYAAAANNIEPAASLKYTENPADAPPGGFVSSVGGVGFRVVRNPSIDRLPMYSSKGDPILSSDWRIVFVHERTNSLGVNRLIMVDFGFWTASGVSLSAWQVGQQFGPDGGYQSLQSNGTVVPMNGLSPGSLRLYAGQIDPTDPAKFYIPFESNGRRGRINGVFGANRVAWTTTVDGPTSPATRSSSP